MPDCSKRHLTAGLVLGLALCWPAASRATGVAVAVAPETLTVAPGDTFTVFVRVPTAGDAFNAYDAVMSFDPAALKFVNRAASVQEGSLLRDSCSTHSTFYLFTAAGDSLAVTDGMLGAACSTTGPGVLLNLRFVALAPPGATFIRFRSVRFYNDGYPVSPVLASGGTIAVGVVLAVPPSPVPPGVGKLRAIPNPSRGACWLGLDPAPAGAAELVILDAAGRLVRKLTLGPGDAARLVPWDGRDSAGRAVPPGVYAAVLLGAAHPVKATLIRLP